MIHTDGTRTIADNTPRELSERVQELNRKRYPLELSGAETFALARIVQDHGNPHRIPAYDTLGRKVRAIASQCAIAREEAYRD